MRAYSVTAQRGSVKLAFLMPTRWLWARRAALPEGVSLQYTRAEKTETSEADKVETGAASVGDLMAMLKKTQGK